MVHNIVAVESENPWLQALDVDGINTQLRERRERFAKKLEDGTFWGLEMKEKEELAPEVRDCLYFRACGDHIIWCTLWPWRTRTRGYKKLEDGTFWGLEMKEKEELAPCTRGTRLPAY